MQLVINIINIINKMVFFYKNFFVKKNHTLEKKN